MKKVTVLILIMLLGIFVLQSCSYDDYKGFVEGYKIGSDPQNYYDYLTQ